jgi:hypothetical protein
MIKCVPYGGKKSKTKSWTGVGAWLRLMTGVCTWVLWQFTTKSSGYLVELRNQDRGARQTETGSGRAEKLRS